MSERLVTILLAEDDPDDRLLFREAISKANRYVTIIEAGTGEVAFEILTKGHPFPDIVVLDINMPELNGMDCLRMIRADQRFDHIPVVMMSTSNDYRTISEARKAGANFYAIKPASFKVLQLMLSYLLLNDWTKAPADADAFLLNNLVS